MAFKTGLRRGKVTSGEQRGGIYRIFPHPQLSTKGKEQGMKRKSLLMNVLVVTAVFWAFGLLGVQTSMAVEEHHQPGATEKAPASTESPGSGKMPGPASGSGPGMMGMMAGPDDASGQGMMGMMDQGMMRMMMSHMMGGPGGMGKMMGQMGAGMKGRAGAPCGMAQMARMLDSLNLTPEQWDQVRGLARERLEKMADLWAQRMKLQIELAGLRWDQEVNPQQVKEVFVKEAEAKAEMFLTSLDYLRKLKGVLTQEQLKKLEAQGL
jgi:hypothetical protein